MDKTPLSVLAFILGAGAGAQAQTTQHIDLKSLEILNEVKMSPEEYQQLMAANPGLMRSNITEGNYDTFNSNLTAANYDTFNSNVTAGNYDTFNSNLTAGNYDTFNGNINNGNYGAAVDPNLKDILASLPSPTIAGE
jgi:hypothetical protein